MNNRGAGHLYVVHGRMGSLDVDAKVIPTDGYFSVMGYWHDITGDPEQARPAGWPTDNGYAVSQVNPSVWFINVFQRRKGTGFRLGDRVRQLVSEIARSGLRPTESRSTLRIAVPVLGIGRGGMGARRGEALDVLLRALWDSVRTVGVDIVLVTPDPAVFGAAQYRRRTIAESGTGSLPWGLSAPALAEAKRLGVLARDGHLALFLGAGVSMAAGLPDWDGLLTRIAERTKQDYGQVKALGSLDAAELLKRDSDQRQIGELVRDIIGKPKKIALAHGILAGFDAQETITTNYDALFELAVEQAGRTTPTVLPWEPAEVGRPWLLKLHGDLQRADSIVLTRRDFVLFDARSRPAGSLLQATLMTRHLLIVGTSLADDNVIRLAMEVDDYLRRNGVRSAQGTFIDVSGKAARQRLWSEQFHWHVCEGEDITQRVRQMEIFLDVAAAYAARNASWLLDPRFEGLLSDSEQRVTAKVRSALAQVPDADSGLLVPLKEIREQLGGAG
ncbi:hypothetical protein GII30_19525 [Gordonia amarae]|uniref:SIR2-like domain-containing protein n=1 Tax=Gordonia amarae TaxID=36821 RepID=A0A857LRY3_9ACTN|nr:SIR2 family protein [Gordonia amarae]MCS3880629.1 NAD-dependent SIR2 family protein deacetylase [Gordonia amarae]QHN18936.1 hypothetical protein GII35_19880 [Gordonia amarae]QHN23411.1 hypothetical protein GII34_19380 [Gordonia amarae]QHN32312.1 hypothetical protein GII32_19695 [Gordonia amarae]QHN41060.1 hypothetical protein GII30_19525 [Gordonia amarae]